MNNIERRPILDENNWDGNHNSRNNNDAKDGETEIGKGLFDGW